MAPPGASGVDDATFAAFSAWMRSRGITWNDEELRLAPRGAAAGGGVFAARRIAPCAVLARIPKVATLTVRTSPIAEDLRAAGLGTEGGVGLAVALMYERSLGAASAWAPYLATLPAQEPLPVTWREAQLRLLVGTALPPSVAADRERLRADWERHVRPLSSADPVRFPPDRFSYDDYVAARTLTASRGFAVDAYHGEGMVPLADLFNHSPDEHVHFTGTGAACACCGRRERVDDDDDGDDGGEEEAGEGEESGSDDGEDASDGDADAADAADGSESESSDGELVALDDVSEGGDDPAELPPPRPASGPCPLCGADVAAPVPPDEADDAFLTMEAVAAVPAGAEVFNTYGARGNAQLLHMYGFALHSTPHDACRCAAPLVAQALRTALASNAAAAAALPSRLALAAQAGLLESAAADDDGDGFELRAGEPLPRELLLLAALAAAPQSVVSRIAALCRKVRASGHVALPAVPDGGPPAGAVAEEPAEVMWHFLAAGPDAEEDSRLPPGADPDDAPPLSAAETARLLRERAAGEALRRVVTSRDALYPTTKLGDDVAALDAAEARAAAPDAPPEAAQEVAALRLRISERRILAAAMELLDQHSPRDEEETKAKPGADAAAPAAGKGAKRAAAAEGGAPAAKRAAADNPAWSLFD